MEVKAINVKRKGQVSTPKEIARFMIDMLLNQNGYDLLNKKFLDPGCGDGIFIKELVERYIKHFLTLKHSNVQSEGEKEKSYFFILKKQLETNFVAIDVEKDKVENTIINLNKTYKNCTGSIDYPKWKILHIDYLSWNLTYIHKFDFIISNPPYIRLENIDKNKLEFLKEKFETAQARFDIYHLFLEHSLNQLNEDGNVCFILPNRFLKSNTGALLRKKILNNYDIKNFLDFIDCSIFKGYTTYPSIIIIRNIRSKGNCIKYGEISNASNEELNEIFTLYQGTQNQNRKISLINMNQEDLIKNGFKFINDKTQIILEKINTKSVPLEKYVKRISAGTATGLDEIFILNQSQISNLETELIVPTIKGKNIRGKRINNPNLWFLLPFRLDSNNKTRLLTEEELETEFPNIFDYLSKHKNDLLKRSCVEKKNKKWYDFHESVDLDIMKQKKIVFPDISNEVSFVIDDKEHFHVAHSVYYLIPKEGISLKLIFQLLNHKFYEKLMKLNSTNQRNGYFRFQSQFMKSLPFPNIENWNKQYSQQNIEKMIIKSFGLTRNEFLYLIENEL